MKGIFVMPPYQQQFVCLATSKKPGGRCIAGKAWGGQHHGTWIRPVSNREHDSISDVERRYANGNSACLLDLTTATFTGVQNHLYQNENHVIAHPPVWTSAQRLTLADIAQLEDRPAQLWELGYRSGRGFNDRVPPSLLTAQRPTLYLIQPTDVSVTVSADGAAFGNPALKVRASFGYNGQRYTLKVTDDVSEGYFQGLGAGTYRPGGITYFTISLGDIDPNTGYAYKLVAAIL